MLINIETLLDNSKFRISTLNQNRGQTTLHRFPRSALVLRVIINHLIHPIRHFQVTFTLKRPFFKKTNQ